MCIFPPTLQSLCCIGPKSLLWPFHSLLILPLETTQLKLILLPYDRPQACKGTLCHAPECPLPQAKRPRVPTHFPAPDFCSFCPFMAHLGDRTRSGSMGLSFIFQTVVHPWMLSITPGPREESRDQMLLLQGQPPPRCRESRAGEGHEDDNRGFRLTSGEPESNLGLTMWDANECLPTPWLQENGFHFPR